MSVHSVLCPYDFRATKKLSRIRTGGSGDKWDEHWYEQLETNEEAATEEILRVANTCGFSLVRVRFVLRCCSATGLTSSGRRSARRRRSLW